MPNPLCRLRPNMRLVAISLTLMLSFSTSSALAQHASADGAGQTFNTLSEQYFQQVYFKYAPTAGTSAGLHQYDTQLEDYSAAGTRGTGVDPSRSCRSPQVIPGSFRLRDRLHPLTQHHHASQRFAAYARRDAAVHARDDPGVDGFPGPVRDALNKSSLQRHATGDKLEHAEDQ